MGKLDTPSESFVETGAVLRGEAEARMRASGAPAVLRLLKGPFNL
ncbi:MAG: hypothetical protein TU35_000280 [Thermoproteus sp. AZ2]|uniref:Uncharacterized protein n=1 Tax=Thermoproteus sp. AZ2 TaxID=1609232 RepID=A0ACC6UYA7_9CREN